MDVSTLVSANDTSPERLRRARHLNTRARRQSALAPAARLRTPVDSH
jgi:hypothetical protein